MYILIRFYTVYWGLSVPVLTCRINTIYSYNDINFLFQSICNNLNYRHKMAQYAGRASVNLHTHVSYFIAPWCRLRMQWKDYFLFHVSSKTYLLVTHWNCPSEAIPISTQKVLFVHHKAHVCLEWLIQLFFNPTVIYSYQLCHSLLFCDQKN